MKFYHHLFLGFYCLVKKALPKEENAASYAVGFMTGALCFIYFTVTILFMKRGASIWETVGIFFIFFGAHYFMFGNKKVEDKKECSDKWIYRSLLYFFTALSLLMYVTTFLGKSN